MMPESPGSWLQETAASLLDPSLRDLDPLERWLEASDEREGECNAFTGYEETLFFASASPITAPRACATCSGPVGFAETYSTFTLAPPPKSESP